ncbi:2-oxo acid dehydrogenase subunit E2 [Micromonospora matsumotoense]|uniref:2-oxo acid dehydrogenase subunit E2 n=1 Tax=Micromonospora matsumotoense TaxID=121616 RepID=UPI00341F09DD
MTSTPIARERRHTLFFLDAIRSFAPVHLDTEVDMSRVVADRARARDDGRRQSVVSHVVVAVGRVLAKHPEANAAIQGRLRARVARYPFVHVKVTMDGTLHGVRVVLATVVPNAHEATVETVQEHLDRARGADPEHGPQFAGIRRVHRTALPVAYARFRRAVGNLAIRPLLTGTVAVTSLGHRDVDGFHSVGGTTVTIGVGRIVPRPVVRDGRVVVAPVLRLSLTFDHRVIDGAEAADVLTDLKQELETGA